MKPNRDHNTATGQETPTKPSLKGEGAAAPVGSGVQEPANNVCRRPPLLEDPSSNRVLCVRVRHPQILSETHSSADVSMRRLSDWGYIADPLGLGQLRLRRLAGACWASG